MNIVHLVSPGIDVAPMYDIIHHMKRTTIFIDEALDSDVRALAKRQGRPLGAVVREAIGQYVSKHNQTEDLKLSFMAIGRSGHHDTADTHEQWLWQDPPPHGKGQSSGKKSPRPRKTASRSRKANR